ncbi:MAG: dTMP kinase [Thermoplasmataceae archaeon]
MFIAIEGIDGSGKSTLSKALEKTLLQSKYKVFRTSEPTPEFDKNRDLLKITGKDDPLLLLALFIKDRSEHVIEMKRYLEKDYIVICDRYFLSTFAYQGSLLREHFNDDEKWMAWMENAVMYTDLVPDITIFLDLSPHNSISRKNGVRRYEMFEDEKYLVSVYKAYQEAIRVGILSKSYHVCDSTKSKSIVLKCALKGIHEKTGMDV